MFRSLKVLGLTIGVALLLSAVMASASMAAQFTASSYPATVTGSNTKGSEVITTEGGKIECDTHSVSHSLGAASSSLTVTPTYTNCEAFGFLNATVNMEACTTVINIYVIPFPPYIIGHKRISCGAGKSIKVTASTCKLEIKGQEGLESVGVSNSGSSVLMKPNISGLAYTVTQDGFLCPFGGTGSKTDGKWTGEVTLSRVGGGSIAVS
jgi:hypothetical protein